MNICESCAYFVYDDEFDEYFCDMNMDEDDVARLMSGHYKKCPFWRNGDEYDTVKHQA